MAPRAQSSGRRARMALCGIGLALASWSASSAAAQLVVAIRAPEDREVAAQLARQIDVPVRGHDDREARSLATLLQEASAWPEPYVVVIDRPADTVHVLRPRDRTVVSRVLDPGVMLDSQYAVALATAELLEWHGVLPAARGRPAQAAPSTPEASPGVRTGSAAEPADSALGWAAGADLELASSPGFDVSLIRPSIAAELQLGRGQAPLWFALGARFGVPASWERSLDAAQFATAASRVEYSDTQVGLHAAIGFGAARATWLAELAGGASFASVEAKSLAGDEVGGHDGMSVFLGVGLGLRYPLAAALSLAAAVDGQWRAGRARYRVEGAEVLEEGPIRVASRVGLIWESALLP